MKGFWQRAYDWLAGLGRYIKKIVLDIFTDAVKDFINRMGPTIEGILKEIQADPSVVVDGDRREAAFNKIVDAAKVAGIETVKNSVVYMAIEMIPFSSRLMAGPSCDFLNVPYFPRIVKRRPAFASVKETPPSPVLKMPPFSVPTKNVPSEEKLGEIAMDVMAPASEV